MELVSFIITISVAFYIIWYIHKGDIEYWLVQRKNKKYYDSELYKFQRAKVKQRFIKYYKELGYIDPQYSAEEQVKLYERNQEINELYQEFKEFKV